MTVNDEAKFILHSINPHCDTQIPLSLMKRALDVNDSHSSGIEHYTNGRKRKKQSIHDQPKTLVFHIPLSGTQGDRKPLFILALFSAQKLGTRTKPVILFDHHHSFLFEASKADPEIAESSELERFLHWSELALGETPTVTYSPGSHVPRVMMFTKLHILLEEGPHNLPTEALHIGTGVGSVCWGAKGYTGRYVFRKSVKPENDLNPKPRLQHMRDCITLDFGDNYYDDDGASEFPGMRMVTSLLTYQDRIDRVKRGHGSIMLPFRRFGVDQDGDGPVEQPWSLDQENVRRLIVFRKHMHRQGRRVATVAMSMGTVPIPPECFKNRGWGFVIVGGDERLTDPMRRLRNVIISNTVEYEDLVQVSDFFISSGGAGSVSIPLYWGIPQYVFLFGDGNDKQTNMMDLIHHKVSPDVRQFDLRAALRNDDYAAWHDLFDHVFDHYHEYWTKAQQISNDLQNHENGLDKTIDMIERMSRRTGEGLRPIRIRVGRN